MPKQIGVIDYGAGNLFSVQRGIRAAGCTAKIVTDPDVVPHFDALVLPGVGAFGAGIDKLRAAYMDIAVGTFVKTGKPLLGICLGMQFLMSRSLEFGEHRGLELIPGDVVPIVGAPGWPIPNIGWCAVDFQRDPAGTPFSEIASGTDFYFVHSYHCVPKNSQDVLGSIEYADAKVVAIVSHNNVHGCQFHPEISADAGLGIYRMLEIVA